MELNALHRSVSPASPSGNERARTPQEAARQFEDVLARQFVDVMTRGLFQEGLDGEDSPAWMGSYRDTQRDQLTDILAEHLVESGAFGVQDLLLRQWGVPTAAEEAAAPTGRADTFSASSPTTDSPDA